MPLRRSVARSVVSSCPLVAGQELGRNSSVRRWLSYRAHVHVALGLIVRHGKQARHMRGAIKRRSDRNI